VELGIAAANLSALNGGGITLGDPLGSYTRPEWKYVAASNSWTSNIPVVLGSGATKATLDATTGLITSANATYSTNIEPQGLTLSSKWRLRYDTTNVSDGLTFQYYDGTAWVTKFLMTP
jgi:hypothetical protein